MLPLDGKRVTDVVQALMSFDHSHGGVMNVHTSHAVLVGNTQAREIHRFASMLLLHHDMTTLFFVI